MAGGGRLVWKGLTRSQRQTHHNDGAVSVACDKSQIESLSVAGSRWYVSRDVQSKSDSASSHIKVAGTSKGGFGTCRVN